MGNTVREMTGAAIPAAPRPTAAPKAPAPRASQRAAVGPQMQLYSAHKTSTRTLVFYFLVAATLALGYAIRGEEYLVAEEGLGYYLGIAGGSMMLLLLLYPVRKKLKAMRRLGATKHWFWAHMVMGILGPVLVIFHSNFSFGSMNSTVALMTTLTVAASGLVGRHLYAKIHYGLYGRMMSLKELKDDLAQKRNDLATVLNYAPRLSARLIAFDDWALASSGGFIQSLFRFLITGLRTVWTRLALSVALRRAIKVTARRSGWTRREKSSRKATAKAHIAEHMRAATLVAEFSIYERLFSLWHLFHFPLFILLVFVGVVHVFAVHLY